MFGALAKRLNGNRVEATFFRKAMALCQDTDYEVRSHMCFQLNAIAFCVGYVVDVEGFDYSNLSLPITVLFSVLRPIALICVAICE